MGFSIIYYIVLITYLIVCCIYYIMNLSGIEYVSFGGLYWVFKNIPFLGERTEFRYALFILSVLVVLILCLAVVKLVMKVKTILDMRKINTECSYTKEEYLDYYIFYIQDSKCEIIGIILLGLVLFL